MADSDEIRDLIKSLPSLREFFEQSLEKHFSDHDAVADDMVQEGHPKAQPIGTPEHGTQINTPAHLEYGKSRPRAIEVEAHANNVYHAIEHGLPPSPAMPADASGVDGTNPRKFDPKSYYDPRLDKQFWSALGFATGLNKALPKDEAENQANIHAHQIVQDHLQEKGKKLRANPAQMDRLGERLYENTPHTIDRAANSNYHQGQQDHHAGLISEPNQYPRSGATESYWENVSLSAGIKPSGFSYKTFPHNKKQTAQFKQIEADKNKFDDPKDYSFEHIFAHLTQQPLGKAQPPHPHNEVLADQLENTQGFSRVGPKDPGDSLTNATRIIRGGANPVAGSGSDHFVNGGGAHRASIANHAEAAKMGFKVDQQNWIDPQYFHPEPNGTHTAHGYSLDPDDINGPGQQYGPKPTSSIHANDPWVRGWDATDTRGEKGFWKDVFQSLPKLPKLNKAWPKDEAENNLNSATHDMLSSGGDHPSNQATEITPAEAKQNVKATGIAFRHRAKQTIGGGPGKSINDARRANLLAHGLPTEDPSQQWFPNDPERPAGASTPREPAHNGEAMMTGPIWPENSGWDGAVHPPTDADHSFWDSIWNSLPPLTKHFSDHDAVAQDMVLENHPKAQDVSADKSKIKGMPAHDINVPDSPHHRTTEAWVANADERRRQDMPGYVEPAASQAIDRPDVSGWEPYGAEGLSPYQRMVSHHSNALAADRQFWRSVGGSARRAAAKKP